MYLRTCYVVLSTLLCFGAVAIRNDAQTASKDSSRSAEAPLERLPQADLGNGYYRNPILRGPGADNTILKVGKDYYMAAGGGWPDQLIWHSRDLVNWRPLTRALKDPSGRAWATDLAYYKGRYFLYTTLINTTKGYSGPLNPSQRSLLGVPHRLEGDKAWDNVVLWADRPEGPWSQPIHLAVYGVFDPGHVVDQEGNRYLYFNKGFYIRLAPDGLSVIGDLKKAYDGWDYPKDWPVECKCLEAPKITFHDGYYYLLSAQGGTSGPATAHMAIVARSKSVEGPWENSPYNPLIHTGNVDYPWSRQGHGTLVEDAAGKWWVQYTGYERGYEFFGKQVLLLPIEWTVDGWPRVPANADATSTLARPAGENIGNGMPLSDNFSGTALGIQWEYTPQANPGRDFHIEDGGLTLAASGEIPGEVAVPPANATMVSVRPVNHSYEATVELTIPAGAEAGMLLDGVGGPRGSGEWADVGLRSGQVVATWGGQANYLPFSETHVFLKLRNIHYDITCFYSTDGEHWKQFPNATRVTNGRRLALYAAGNGNVVFHNFTYRGID